MPLETGTWTINENGTVDHLTITGVDVAGNVSGTLFAAPISGFWNEVLQKLTFIWPSPEILGQPEKLYTGFLFTDQFRMPGIKGGTVFTLAGYFTAFATGTDSVDRSTFGWYAQIGAA
jgi:hypothetical protein